MNILFFVSSLNAGGAERVGGFVLEAAGGVRAWLLPRLSERESAWLRSRGLSAPLDYFEYDWSLNDAAR